MSKKVTQNSMTTDYRVGDNISSGIYSNDYLRIFEVKLEAGQTYQFDLANIAAVT